MVSGYKAAKFVNVLEKNYARRFKVLGLVTFLRVVGPGREKLPGNDPNLYRDHSAITTSSVIFGQKTGPVFKGV